MKKLLITLTLILTLCLTAFTLPACDKGSSDTTNSTTGVKYRISEDGTYAEVAIYKGSSTKVKIADTYENLPVKSIGEEAFWSCSILTSVEIPDSITSIGRAAFQDCRSLTTVTFKGNSKLTSIGEDAFSYCRSLTSIEIPNSVEIIKRWAFRKCISLTNVTIGNGLTYISEHAFSNCDRLVEIINKSEHITITKGSYDNGCLGLMALSVSNREDNYVSKLSTDKKGFVIYTDGKEKILVNYIGKETDIIIPNVITKINIMAFSSCHSLTSVVIPYSVASIGDLAFRDCLSLTSIYCEVESQPSGWDSEWKSWCSAEVVWGYKGEN